MKHLNKLDTNHDGKLSLDELLEGAKEIYPEMTDEDITNMFEKADTFEKILIII